MSPQRVAFILGAGPRIGWGIASKPMKNGYHVAWGSRTSNSLRALGLEECKLLAVPVNVSDISSVQAAFAHVKKDVGIPNVVIYNVSAYIPADSKDPFGSVTPWTPQHDNAANVTGAYTTFREAISGFKSLSRSSISGTNDIDGTGDGRELPKVLIATGNVTPFQPIPSSMPSGIGKSSLVHMTQIAAKAYNDQGFRFYYASQVSAKGGPVRNIDATAHGTVYWDLINRPTQGNWDVRFFAGGSEVEPR